MSDVYGAVCRVFSAYQAIKVIVKQVVVVAITLRMDFSKRSGLRKEVCFHDVRRPIGGRPAPSLCFKPHLSPTHHSYTLFPI